MASSSKSAAVRARLDHPVIDGDGHWLEPMPIFLDYLQGRRRAVGRRQVRQEAPRTSTWYDLAPEERMRRRLHRPTWWGEPANTLDRATAMIPRLFYERLDDFGIDFCVLYTSLGLFFIGNPDEEIRRATARAVNRMNAELFKPYAHRITPGGGGAGPHARGGDRGGDLRRPRARAQGADDRQPRATAGPRLRPRGGAAQRGADLRRLAGLRERLRLRPVLAALRRSEDRGDRALRQHGHQLARVGVELHLQPHRPLRQRQPRLRQGAHPGRRHPSLPAAALRHAGGRRGLGVQPGDRPRRPLGAPAARGDGEPDRVRPTSTRPQLRTPVPRVRRRAPTRTRSTRSSRRSTWPSRSRAPSRRPSAPTSRSASTTSPPSPCSRARSCAATSPSASSSAARPTTR